MIASSSSLKPKILLAEDDPHVRQMVTILLEEAGYEVDWVESGEEFLAIFEESSPDLVLLDIYLEGRVGFDLCRWIRRQPLGMGLPVVFLTSLVGEERVVEGLDAGADDYIVKPFRPKELLARVRSQLARVDRAYRAHAASASSALASGAEIDGTNGLRYLILRRVSRGGMGVVYLAEELTTGREVAIKTLDSKHLREEKELQRFLREAQATLELDHPNLAKGLEVVCRGDLCFYSMEYVQGRTVAELVEREGSIEPERACRIVLQVAGGLAHLEERELVHRDVKPENIILDEAEHATLVDFGLMKPADCSGCFTTEGIILGTPYYLSPEQVKGMRNLDIRSDVFSLGATFYFMLTGAKPFEGETTVGIINQRLFQDPIPPSRRNGRVDDRLSRIVGKMMARRIEDRYASPRLVARDIELVLAGESPALAVRKSVRYDD